MPSMILLVDDNKDLLQVATMVLNGQGYATVQATAVEPALAQIERHRPALILLDVDINGEDGRVLCSRLKKDAQTRGIRIIMMSGDDVATTITDADDFLAKPFDFGELVSRVEKQLAAVPAS